MQVEGVRHLVQVGVKEVVSVIFGICKASNGYTNKVKTFLKHTFGRSILELATSSITKGGGDSNFRDFRGFVRLEKCRLDIFVTYIRKIYL